MTENIDDDKLLSIEYISKPKNDLNAQLDAMAEISGGKFVSCQNTEDSHIRKYFFEKDEDSCNFHEISHIILSRYFDMEPVTFDQMTQQLYWTSKEATYHHASFVESGEAKRFATMLRATLSAYLSIDMFDVFFVKTEEEDMPFAVIWCFPNDSIIDIQEYDNNDDEIMKWSGVLGPENKKKGDLN